MGKFAKQANELSVDLGALFSRAIRQAVMAGLVMALQVTKHDSSNAAVHWQVAAKGRSRPASRRYGQLRDLRETSTRPGVPPVGRRRDAGKNAKLAERFVRDKELREVVEKLVAGRSPETVFYFFNAIDPGSEYGHNANIEDAGRAAVEEVRRIFENRMAAGQVRKSYR
jgi:hypothetical protein